MKSLFRHLVLLLVVGCGLAGFGVAAEGPGEALAAAWAEYGFQMFDTADDLFAEAATDPSTRRHGELGRAMSLYFRERGPDPEGAITRYRALLAEEVDDDVSLLAGSLLAEALWETGETGEADEHWERVITANPDHIVAQDALLRRTVAHVGDLRSAETGEAVAYAEAWRAAMTPPTRERPGLFPALDNLLGQLHFHRHAYEAARAAYMRAIAIGSLETTSPTTRGNLLMQIAQLSEKYLDDPETAGRYYRQLAMELPMDVRSFYSIEKAVRYGTLTREEIKAMDLNGLTEERLDEIMAKGAARP